MSVILSTAWAWAWAPLRRRRGAQWRAGAAARLSVFHGHALRICCISHPAVRICCMSSVLNGCALRLALQCMQGRCSKACSILHFASIKRFLSCSVLLYEELNTVCWYIKIRARGATRLAGPTTTPCRPPAARSTPPPAPPPSAPPHALRPPASAAAHRFVKLAACRLPPAACRLPPAVCRLPPAVCRLPLALLPFLLPRDKAGRAEGMGTPGAAVKG
jgi:hypothetical protein